MDYGINASSFMEGKRYSNTENLTEYIQNIEKNTPHKNLVLDEVLNDEDKMDEYMMLSLRTIKGVNIQKFKQKFGINPIAKYCKILEKLSKEGLIQVDENNISLTNKGIDLANLVWEEFV